MIKIEKRKTKKFQNGSNLWLEEATILVLEIN
jgi:ribosome-associated protein YbcJ (S4-like RNA binding protein)